MSIPHIDIPPTESLPIEAEDQRMVPQETVEIPVDLYYRVLAILRDTVSFADGGGQEYYDFRNALDNQEVIPADSEYYDDLPFEGDEADLFDMIRDAIRDDFNFGG